MCALDTELLGHWWYEGIAWLRAVVEECARQGLELVRLDDALERSSRLACDATATLGLAASTWGTGGDLSTWSGPAVAEMAFAHARARAATWSAPGARAAARRVRELLALQASDWPFMVSREIAAPYARERFDGHRRRLARALEPRAPTPSSTALRNLAADADRCVPAATRHRRSRDDAARTQSAGEEPRWQHTEHPRRDRSRQTALIRCAITATTAKAKNRISRTPVAAASWSASPRRVASGMGTVGFVTHQLGS